MAPPSTILFDLDGTLVDSIELILNSARFAFEKLEREWISDAEWSKGIGIPLSAMFGKYSRDEAEVRAFIGAYREYQMEHHDRLVRCYDSVIDVVDELASRGHSLGVVTSKSEYLAWRGLALVGLASRMDTIVGIDSSSRHKPDPEPVRIALHRLDAAPGEAVFVGDSVHDMMAGNAAGVTTVAALWGAFSRADMEPGEPNHWLTTISELPSLLGSH